MSIRKDIEVTRKGLDTIIDVTYGTELLQIELKITDYQIPEGATAVAYADTSGSEPKKLICNIEDNSIIFTPVAGFFEVGRNDLQVRIVHDNKSLFSFKCKVNCQDSPRDDDAKEIAAQPTLVEELITRVSRLTYSQVFVGQVSDESDVEGKQYLLLYSATEGKKVLKDDLIINSDGTIYLVTSIEDDKIIVETTGLSIVGPKGEKGKDGLSIWYINSEPEMASDQNGMIDKNIIDNGEREVNVGDLILTPNFDMYEITQIVEGSHYDVSFIGGINGKDGKTAYEYAKDGGYSGTEQDFANKLAKEIPVESVNGKTGAVEITSEDVGADPSGTATKKVSEHNVATNAHNDIRLLIRNLTNAFNAFMDIDDETLNQASEFAAYMKDNRELIEQITTNKVSVSDIVDDYVTNVSNKPVSAAVAVKLKKLIDEIIVPTLLSQLQEDSAHRLVTDEEKETWNSKSVVTYNADTRTLNICSGGGY